MDKYRRYSQDLLQGGLEVPCKLIFGTESVQICNKTKGLIHASLAVSNTEYPEAITKSYMYINLMYTVSIQYIWQLYNYLCKSFHILIS